MDTVRILPAGPGPVRVFVADPRSVLVDRVAVLADEYEDLKLAGAEASGMSAVGSVSRAKPAVVLIAEQFPDADGLDVCRDIHRAVPRAALIFISTTRTDIGLLRAVEAGACGVASPLAPDEELVTAILRAADGDLLFSRSTIQRLFAFGRELRIAESGGCGQEKRA